MNHFVHYREELAPYLETFAYDVCRFDELARAHSNNPIGRLRKPDYDTFHSPTFLNQEHTRDLATRGWTIVSDAVDLSAPPFQSIREKTEIPQSYISEFADKDPLFATEFAHILNEPNITQIAMDLNEEDDPFFGWQKVSIHKRSAGSDSRFNVGTFEHVDTSETPKVRRMFTQYIPLTDQSNPLVSQMFVYEGTHRTIQIPSCSYDYVGTGEINIDLIADLNRRVAAGETERWVRDSYLKLLLIPSLPTKFQILPSALILLAYNQWLYDVPLKPIPLQPGDMLIFATDLLHGATLHQTSAPRIAIALRASTPYVETAHLIKDSICAPYLQKVNKARIKKEVTYSEEQIANSFWFSIPRLLLSKAYERNDDFTYDHDHFVRMLDDEL